jgi:hypothetical protein
MYSIIACPNHFQLLNSMRKHEGLGGFLVRAVDGHRDRQDGRLRGIRPACYLLTNCYLFILPVLSILLA